LNATAGNGETFGESVEPIDRTVDKQRSTCGVKQCAGPVAQPTAAALTAGSARRKRR
jgi:hypothetical protein